MTSTLPGLPDRIEIYEVGPRDGLQNESAVVPVEVKAELVRRLVAAGLRTVELTSFVPARWVPQLADADQLLALLGPLSGRHPVLVPNDRGLDRALAAGVREIAVFASATETFARRNLNRTVAASLEMFAPVVARARAEDLAVRGYVSMCFGDPWEGPVLPAQVADVAVRLADMGCTEISLGDTTGVGTPGQVAELLTLLAQRGVPVAMLAVHFHDTYGQALANTMLALQQGVTTVDASAGGLGGCPYAASATGNLATEDLVWMLHGLGIATGVDLPALVATSLWMADRLGRPSPSRTLAALAPRPEESSLMLDTRLTDEQVALRRTVEQFAREVVAPVSYHHDKTKTFPYDVVRQMGEMGLFGLPFPEELGGMGGDYFALCLALEELARVDQSVAITLEAGVSLGAMPVYRFGTKEQQQQWLPLLASGQALGAFGLTEPGGGSDAGATSTTAVLTDGQWVVNGSKAFITNSGTDLTRLVTVTAVTGTAGTGQKEISAILVPTPTPGFTAGPAYDKVGWNASDTHPLTLEDVRVPEANLLGERGRGYANFLQILDEGRIAISALSVGAAQGCVDESVRYANQREAFGRPIGHNQAIAFKIARMEARVHVARTAYYDAAARMLAGVSFKKQAAIAKLVSGEAAMDNARDATQVHGGYGFMNEFAVARHYRDSKILEIGEGTTEVQLMLIAREIGL